MEVACVTVTGVPDAQQLRSPSLLGLESVCGSKRSVQGGMGSEQPLWGPCSLPSSCGVPESPHCEMRPCRAACYLVLEEVQKEVQPMLSRPFPVA